MIEATSDPAPGSDTPTQATASPAIAGAKEFAPHLVGAEPRQRGRGHIGLHPDRHRHATASDGAEFLGHHQRIAVVQPLAAELSGLVEAEEAEIAEFLEQFVRGKLLRFLPFIDEGIDFRRNEFLQGAARFVVVGGEEHFCSLSFRGGAERRTRNLDVV